MMKRMIPCVVLVLSIFMLGYGLAVANKSSAAIEAPQAASKGSDVTIRVTVTHSANTALHYTEWLKVTVNKKEVARWDFTSGNRPEAAEFTREVKVKASEDLEVVAEASCNNHGSKGPATVKISVK
jgi:desulfoferrodoxin (superoxide reductase-like protein)